MSRRFHADDDDATVHYFQSITTTLCAPTLRLTFALLLAHGVFIHMDVVGIDTVIAVYAQESRMPRVYSLHFSNNVTNEPFDGFIAIFNFLHFQFFAVSKKSNLIQIFFF